MEQILCACGCGQTRPRLDKRGRERRYIAGHQNKEKTKRQMEAAAQTMKRIRPRVPWNKGKTYVHASKGTYANKGAWNEAMRRLYPDRCMRCGWEQASCDTHHIIPKSNGGGYTIGNGIILCPNCHRLANFGLLAADELRSCKGRCAMIGQIV